MTGDESRRRFEELVRRHRGEIYRAVLRQTRSREEAEDITQTAMLHAYRAWERGELPEHPRAWMFAIAENARRGLYRKTRSRPTHVELSEDVVDMRAADAPLGRELLDAVARLPERQRAVLVLREMKGLSYQEIAEELGETLTAVQMLLFRARRTLRAELRPQRRVVDRLALFPASWFQIFQPGGVGPVAARTAGGIGALALGLLVAGSVPSGGEATTAPPQPRERVVSIGGSPARPAQSQDRPAAAVEPSAQPSAARRAAPHPAGPAIAGGRTPALPSEEPEAQRPTAPGGHTGAGGTPPVVSDVADADADAGAAASPREPRRGPGRRRPSPPPPPETIPIQEVLEPVEDVLEPVEGIVDDVRDVVDEVVEPVAPVVPPPLPAPPTAVPDLPVPQPPPVSVTVTTPSLP
jgi:RNA polymerase sigma-70 factor (ECF subfamily)